MIDAMLQTFTSPFVIAQSGPTNSLGLDILIYSVIAIGFIILGYFISDFINKTKIRKMEAELDAEKERLGRRINTLEKEVKHLYSKDDEQAVIINDLKKQLYKNKPLSKSENKRKQKENPPDLFGGFSSEEEQ